MGVKWVTDRFPGAKQQRFGVDRTPPCMANFEVRLELSRVFPSGLHGLFYGSASLYLYLSWHLKTYYHSQLTLH
jgi:hypothetical protein